MQGSTSQDLQGSLTAPMDQPATPVSRGHDHDAYGQPQPRPQVPSDRHGPKKSKQVCRFYGTKRGCRAQGECPYLHDQQYNPALSQPSATKPNVSQDRHVDNHSTADEITDNAQNSEPTKQKTAASNDTKEPARRQVVSKPVPARQQKDPREFQIAQIIRRFSPSRDDKSDQTLLNFRLQPSDPDFPFELEALECILTVPASYPKGARPTIRVENKDMPRGFQINVERGFDELSSNSPGKTLLQLLNDLDRNLEKYLTAEKAQTIKIVANKPTLDNTKKVTTPAPESVPSSSRPPPTIDTDPVPIWSAQARADAKTRRENEIRQLEARMSRIPSFAISNDGVSFNIPLQIAKPSKLPLALQSLKEVTLIVPVLYGLEPCRVRLKGVSGKEVGTVEAAFTRRAREHKEMTLMAHINYLTQNLPSMSTVAMTLQPENTELSTVIPDTKLPPDEAEKDNVPSISEVIDEDRPHLRFISHPPPEWNRTAGDDDEDETSEDVSSEDDLTDEEHSDASVGNESHAGGATLQAPAPKLTLEKGVLLSFPHLELHGVELLEIHSLSLSVKCDRCKSTVEVKNIKPADPNSTFIRTESCQKCASSVAISFRSEPLHANSIKAGYLDLEGCTVVDMLLSQFVPTCSECSTALPLPGIATVRGDSPLSVCRECHHRLNFKIPEVKFLRVAFNDARLHLPLRSKHKKENLGISAGTELPDRGRCRHYAKSYRWFRFSCCSRVYPCDRCHDEKEDHPNEHGNRMICGWCSREQNYRPEDCGVCGRSVIRKTGGGFWEGGKGTRDKVRMNRKDPRKYKRIGGGAKGGEK